MLQLLSILCLGALFGDTQIRYAFCNCLKGKSTWEKKLSRIPRHRWEDNIRMDLKEIGINTRNWVDSTQDRIIGDPL